MRDQMQVQTRGNSVGNGGKASATVKAMPGRDGKDAALMERVASAMDRGAFHDIASHYAPRLKSWLVYRGTQSSTAEDIVQEVMISVWSKAKQFDPLKGAFSAWVYRMTRNHWIDYKRKHDRLQPTDPDRISDMADIPIAGADAAFNQSETAQAVQAELAKLPLDQKQMLHLAFFEGLTHSQIAERTGLALGTVKGRIRAPLKKLKNRLENFRGVDQ